MGDVNASDEPFELGEILRLAPNRSTARVRTLHGERDVRLGLDAWPLAAELDMGASPQDLCALTELHTAALLHCLRDRFEREGSYATWLGRDSLLWLHPCGPTPALFGGKRMIRAAVSSDARAAEEPHPYALAERALRDAVLGSPRAASILFGAPRD